jgi:hypothetical protein
LRLCPLFSLRWFKSLLESCDAAYNKQLEGSYCSVAPAASDSTRHTGGQNDPVPHSYRRGDWRSEEVDKDASYNRRGQTSSSNKTSDMVQCMITHSRHVHIFITHCHAQLLHLCLYTCYSSVSVILNEQVKFLFLCFAGTYDARYEASRTYIKKEKSISNKRQRP